MLKSIASILMEITNCKGAVCRWGGEEFAILLYKSNGASQFAENVRKKLEHTKINVENDTINITVSIGVAVADPKDKLNINDLLKNADNCLYDAKKRGRNRVVTYEKM